MTLRARLQAHLERHDAERQELLELIELAAADEGRRPKPRQRPKALPANDPSPEAVEKVRRRLRRQGIPA